jgi:hypothetical protein
MSTEPKAQSQSKWDDRFMSLARHIAEWSKDRSRKTGCVIVGPNREIPDTTASLVDWNVVEGEGPGNAK